MINSAICSNYFQVILPNIMVIRLIAEVEELQEKISAYKQSRQMHNPTLSQMQNNLNQSQKFSTRLFRSTTQDLDSQTMKGTIKYNE